MLGKMQQHLQQELEEIKEAGLFKAERIITTPQKSQITVSTGEKVINMCANNYLGLSAHPEVIKSAQSSFEQWGYGLSSVRFICGTQDVHKKLESSLANFLKMDDVILYSS